MSLLSSAKIIDTAPFYLSPESPDRGGKDLIQTQSRQSDPALFNDDTTPDPCRSETSPPAKPDYSTVRIYGNSVDFSEPLSVTGTRSVRPSVITVERASLCQIFLETKYHKTFEEPTERQRRRETLQSLVCKGKELTGEQKDKFAEILKSVESEWSRLSRVRTSVDAFEVIRKLGSGGFGVVNLVQEKQTGKLFAMKV